MKKRVKYYHQSGPAVDKNGVERMITVVGKFEQTRQPVEFESNASIEEWPGKEVKGKLTLSRKLLTRKFTMGLAICDPTDTYDEEIGIKVAKKRIKQGNDLGTVYTNDVTMLTVDGCLAELNNKFKFVSENIDKYLPEE